MFITLFIFQNAPSMLCDHFIYNNVVVSSIIIRKHRLNLNVIYTISMDKFDFIRDKKCLLGNTSYHVLNIAHIITHYRHIGNTLNNSVVH